MDAATGVPGIEAEYRSSPWSEGPVPALTVGIPTHDHPDFLADLLGLLESQDLGRDHFEVVVVDDASSAATWSLLGEAVERSRLRIRALRLDANGGPAAARNVAAAAARAPLIVFIDDDCLPTPGWLAAYAAAFAGDADLVQGRTLGEQGRESLGPWARTVWVTGESWLFETCNIGYRRSSFERLAGFDARRPDVTAGSRPHFGEDAELGWRFRSAGMRTTFAPEALAYHRVLPGTYRDWLREQRRRGLFPALVGRTAGMRGALFLGTFLSKETAGFDLAVASVIAAALSRRPWVVAGALPWLWMRWRATKDRPGKARLFRLAQLGVGDAIGLVSLAAGSLRARRVVL